MKDFEVVNIGNILEDYKGSDTIRFDIGETGATVHVALRNLTEYEIGNFQASSPFQIRYVIVDGIIMMLFKFGDMAWMDTPYSPHIGLKPTTINFIKEGEGLALTIYLIEAATGELKNIRLIGLGTDFSKKLMVDIQNARLTEFNLAEYNAKLNCVFSKYDTKKLVQIASAYYKLK